MWAVVARWVFGFFVRDLLLEYGWQIVSTLLIGLVVLVTTAVWALSIMAQPGGIYWLASQAPPELQAQHPIVSVGMPTGGFNPSLPATPLGQLVGPIPGGALPAPPAEQWLLMQQIAQGAGGCNFDPVWLAAVAFYESSYGQNPGPSSAGAWGYGQFMPETLAAYGISRQQALDFHVMLPAMATYLCRAGIAQGVDGALYAYNHSRAYVEYVKFLASTWFKTRLPSWVDGVPWNQFSPASWRDPHTYAVWHAAACSAAALAWMLRAYNARPVAYLDDAVALLGPSISAEVGLRDHRGPSLAAALSSRGLSAWNAHLASSQDLVDKLRFGPLLLDGQGWFGVGHWFVATASDPSGISIRESSGNDIRYLTWQQLYGPVGWSGWAVGVLAR